LVYFSATFVATYALWLAGAYLSFQDEYREWYMVLMLLGMMTPFLISLVMIFRSSRLDFKPSGETGEQNLLSIYLNYQWGKNGT
jgi:hypothetical protein